MKTKVKTKSKDSFVGLASQMARNPDTLAAFTEVMNDAARKREIGERIAEQRERRGLTQPQTVERLGMKPAALRKYQYWEEGSHLPSNDVLEEVATVVGCSFDYLLTGGEEAPPAQDILSRLDLIEATQERILKLVEENQAEASEYLAEQDEPRGHGQGTAQNG